MLLGAPWNHPHNAYLRLLLDSGLFGIIPILGFFTIVVMLSFRLFTNKDPFLSVIGASCLAAVLAQLIGSIGAQSFNPRPGVLVMWVFIGLAFRVGYRPFDSKEVAEKPVSSNTHWKDQFDSKLALSFRDK